MSIISNLNIEVDDLTEVTFSEFSKLINISLKTLRSRVKRDKNLPTPVKKIPNTLVNSTAQISVYKLIDLYNWIKEWDKAHTKVEDLKFDLQYVAKILKMLDEYYKPEIGFCLNFYGDESFGIEYDEKIPEDEVMTTLQKVVAKNSTKGEITSKCRTISFYQAHGVGELLAYCKFVENNIADAYKDK